MSKLRAECIVDTNGRVPENEFRKGEVYEVELSSKPTHYIVYKDGSPLAWWYPKKWFRLI